MESDDCICEDACDQCGERLAGVLFHCRGTPVLFLCYKCSPRNFETVGAQTVTRVLSYVLQAA
jgi:hypothetical protein